MAMITVFTGNGKGKTTSALGLAVAARARNLKAIMVQFLKGSTYSGELLSFYRLGIPLVQFGVGCKWSAMIRAGLCRCNGCGECFRENRRPDVGGPLVREALAFLHGLLEEGEEYRLIILDEISHALRYGFLELDELKALLAKAKGRDIHWVLTGRGMPPQLMEVADEWWELDPVKHPFNDGLKSRRGIEY